MQQKNTLLPWFLIAVLSLIWGTSFILIKRGLSVYGPAEVGALRLVSAGMFLLPVAITRAKMLRKVFWKKLFFVGLMGSFIPAFLFAYGQTGIISSMAGMLNSLTPFVVMTIGVLFFKQKIRILTGIGLFMGLAGTIILLLSGTAGQFGSLNFYALFIVLAVFCYSINLNFVKFYLAEVPAVTITSVSLSLVFPLALLYLLGFSPFLSILTTHPEGYLAAGHVVLLGVLGTALALILFNKLVQLTTPLFTSLVTYFIPMVAVFWGIFDDEKLLLSHFAGLLVIIAGVYVVNHSNR